MRPIKDVRRKARSVVQLLRCTGPEREVPKFWLFRTGNRLDRKFLASTPLRFGDFEGFLQIEVKDQIFLWPKDAPRAGILRVLSEILTPEHPHHYVWGHTKIDESDIVLDIGACEGAFSALVTAQCRRVIAVEPSRTMCTLIPALFRARGERCPEVLNCLLGGEPGRAYFLENGANPGASRVVAEPAAGAYELSVRTLDDLAESLEQKPTFIKCDAEGAEPAIFSGGKGFLRKLHPKLAITTYHNDGDYAAMHALLTLLGYRVAGKGFLFSPSAGALRVQMIHAW